MENIVGEYPVYYGSDKVGELQVTKPGLMYIFSARCTAPSTEVMRLGVKSGGRFVTVGVLMPSCAELRLTKKFSRSGLAEAGISEIAWCGMVEAEGGVVRMPSPPGETAEPASAPPAEPEAVQVMDKTPEIKPPEPDIRSPKPEVKPPETEIRQPEPDACPPKDMEMPEPEPEPEKPGGGWAPEPSPWEILTDPELADACRDVEGAYSKKEDGDIYLAVPLEDSRPFPLTQIFCRGIPDEISGGIFIVFKTRDGKLAD